MAVTRGAAARTALITGASSGIGEALALSFAADGHALVWVDNTGVLSLSESLAEELTAR